MKSFLCWYKNGSAREVDAGDHEAAAKTAQELASLENADLDRVGPTKGAEYLWACRVVKTECRTDGTVQRWR